MQGEDAGSCTGKGRRMWACWLGTSTFSPTALDATAPLPAMKQQDFIHAGLGCVCRHRLTSFTIHAGYQTSAVKGAGLLSLRHAVSHVVVANKPRPCAQGPALVQVSLLLTGCC